MSHSKWIQNFQFFAIFVLAMILTMPATAGATGDNLKPVFIEVKSASMVKKLARMGIDIAAVRRIESKSADLQDTFRVEVVLSSRDEKKLKTAGIEWQEVQRNINSPKAMSSFVADPTDTVYHSFDESGVGIKDRIYQVAAEYPNIVELETIGYSIQNRPLLALRLSKKNKHFGNSHKKRKPEVLILATHHAREWVATQMAMRLVDYLTSNYGVDGRVTAMLDSTQIWIVPVANPDGYQYTFTNERLWRKNLRDNDEDGEISLVDGVDLNRNFSSRWGLDDEGSSPIWSDATFRGTTPNSEPETQAVVDFIQSHRFKFLISYHTYSNLILYPWGWQIKTPSFDDPIFVAQAGTDDNPAIFDNLINVGYDPGVGADLYTTNGDFTDWTYGEADIPSYTVELTQGYSVPGDDSTFYGFEFPDDEAMVQQVFEDNLEFAFSLIESAKNPAKPKSPVGIETEDIYHQPLASSWGKRQTIEVLARIGHRPPKLYYKINDRRWRSEKFKEMLGEFYNETPGLYYSGYRASVRKQQTGDTVKYYIQKGQNFLGPYTYTVEIANDSSVLVVSAEDYSGQYPDYVDQTAPNYLGFYTDALDANGYIYDVWDVTAKEAAPTYTEVLSNYDAAIWYTGDDYAATVPGFEVHEDMVLAMRKYLNYGGKIFATGQDLSALSTVYNEFDDDFFQYLFGAYIHSDEAGMAAPASPGDPSLPFNVRGKDGDPILDGLEFTLSGGDGANNQVSADSFLATNYFNQNYENHIAAHYVRPGGPFDPHSGAYYTYSQMADQAYKRIGGTFDLPIDAAVLSFWTSFDIEADWDFAFVEIREVGTDDWTTLPDLGGLSSQATGDSCVSGWVDQIHPQLGHYVDENCNPTGTTGEWHAFTGNSSGWKQIQVDLSAYAGKQVEFYISYATDWGTQNLGFFLDDIELDGYPLQDFETDLGDYQVTSPPENTPFNNWIRMEGAGFPEGPVVRTDNTVYMGFGFEAINSNKDRSEIMGRVMQYLGQ